MALQAHIAAFNERVRPADKLPAGVALNKDAHTQKRFSKAVDKQKLELLGAAYADSPEDQARLRSKQSHNAHAFLTRPRTLLASSSFASPQMTSPEYRIAECVTLGIDVRSGATSCPFPHEARVPLGRQMEHAIRCKQGGGAMKAHTGLEDLLLETARRADITAEKEPPDLIPGTQLKPADVLLRGVEGTPLAVDVTIVDTLQARTLRAAAAHAGEAARQKEAAKVAKYRSDLSRNNIRFTAFAIESFGYIGAGARSVLDLLATRISRREDEPLSTIKHFLFYSFGTLVRQSVAQRILARIPASGSPSQMIRLR
jgi:hypothetical protein